MPEKLTSRQGEVYEFIREKILTRGYGPSIREICDHLGIKSPNGVICHLKALEKKGAITRQPYQSRAIELTQEGPTRTLPIVGRIGAERLEVSQATGEVDLNRFFDHRESYVLRMTGDSMIEAHITDGDLLVVEPREPSNGELVVAEAEEGRPIIKFWFREANQIRLQSANQSVAPTFVEHVKINGVVVGVVRKCSLNRPRVSGGVVRQDGILRTANRCP